jgi:hypothetical protein
MQDEFGEPGTVVCAAQLGEELKKGDKLLDIHWEGYQRTASDELYHAVWVRICAAAISIGLWILSFLSS